MSATLLEQIRKSGGKELSIAHWGLGKLAHLAAADFQTQAGAKLLEVPYKGIAPVAAAIGGGEVDLAFVPLGGSILGMIQTGRIKAIAVASAKRHPLVPDLPTMAENPRFKNFEFAMWTGLLAPAKTPSVIAARLTKALQEWTESPEYLALATAQGARKMDLMSPQQAGSYFRAESDKFISIAKTLNLVPQ